MNAPQESAFIQRIENIDEYTQILYQNAEDLSWRQPQQFINCLEELRLALEELRVAEEEVQEQNASLMAAQATIEAERRQYRELFEFAPDGYLVTDPHGIVREANQVARNLLEIQQELLLGKPLSSFIPAAQRRAFRTVLNQLPTLNRIQEWEIGMCGKENRAFDAALTVETVRNEQGIVALRWLVRDITVRKQAEEQFRQVQMQNLQLIEADRLKNQFMATLSHELRTPMNAILGFSELLMRHFRHQPDSLPSAMLERILRNGKHLLDLIEELLDFSKLKAKHLELHLESFNLTEFTAATVEELRSLAAGKAIDLQVQIPQTALVIQNDRTRLRQIITNLLSNAIKFTEVGSVILEVWELPGERFVLIVQDTGIGIEPADQARIFQEFWQVNQSATRKYEGTGLGLAIVSALVQLMQGSISVDSQPGKGTVFRVELPKWVTPPSASAQL